MQPSCPSPRSCVHCQHFRIGRASLPARDGLTRAQTRKTASCISQVSWASNRKQSIAPGSCSPQGGGRLAAEQKCGGSISGSPSLRLLGGPATAARRSLRDGGPCLWREGGRLQRLGGRPPSAQHAYAAVTVELSTTA